MSIINSQPLIGASGNQSTAYNLTRSLRFRSSASAYLNRTPASAGNRKTWTWSAWVKKANYPNAQAIFSAGTDANAIYIEGGGDGTIGIDGHYNGTRVLRYTTAAFRDFSAWYHVVVVLDTTQATDSNRIKLYVNGVQVSLPTANVGTWPAQNSDGNFNSNVAHSIGRRQNIPDYYYDGYLAENHFIDGQALTPSDFGETDTATGVWKPKKYTGTYGTNGFYLKFDNLTSTSTLGNDSSGNSNTWTVNNISLTSGSTYDSMKDVPTLTDADTANYCVLSPISNSIAYSITNGNLSISNGSTQRGTKPASFFLTSGKWYWEAAGNGYVGAVCGNSGVAFAGSASGTGSNAIGYWEGGIVYWDGGNSGTGASYTSSDTIGIALDMDSGTVAFYKNNTLQYTATFGSGTVPNLSSGCFPCYNDGFSTTAKSADFNFGQRPFTYTPPSGFKALNTFNLPTPTIGATASTQANDYFDVTLYTGNGASRSIVNSGAMSPDLVWIKNRSQAYAHRLFDTNRGAEVRLFSNTTDAEGTSVGSLTAFNSDGFSLGADTAGPAGYGVNENGSSFVAWQWRASDSTAVSNTAGSITSTVSANTTAGFSIVTFTSASSGNFTVGHGLGVKPAFIILKTRDTAGYNWHCWHQSLSSNTNSVLLLNTTDAESTSFAMWGASGANTTTIGITSGNPVPTSSACVAYCFAEVAGYSKFGSYTGNGSTDGVFVYLGFRPSFIMIKKSSSTGNWMMFDSKRLEYNGSSASKELYSNLSLAEGTSNGPDELSNGFKLRDNYSDVNTNGDTYIYIAFAENPFKYSLAR